MTFDVRILATGDVDDAIADLRAVRLERRSGSVRITCPAVPLARAIATLARAGLAASPTEPAPPADRPAIVAHLRPFAVDGLHDVLDVRAAPLGEAVALVRAATRDLFGRRALERRERLSALLSDRDRVLVWRRVVYAPAALLRSRRLGGVRPVVFDTGAVDRARERATYVSAGALAAWIRS